MKTYRFILSLLVSLVTIGAYAADFKEVKGEYTYYGDGNDSPQTAKQKALEGARAAAIANEFGTNISQSVWQRSTETDEMFDMLSNTEVRGEWIRDLGEPDYKMEMDPKTGWLVVTCKVRGTARAISNEAAQFTAVALRNGIDDRFESASFKEGDQMYLKFEAPSDGYVAVYLACPDQSVYTLLPYTTTTGGQVKVKGGKNYVFFNPNPQLDKLYGTADEMVLNVADGDTELNRLYVVFSPNSFSKAVDSYVSDKMPRRLSFADYAKWMERSRKNDPRMGIKIMNLEIRK